MSDAPVEHGHARAKPLRHLIRFLRAVTLFLLVLLVVIVAGITWLTTTEQRIALPDWAVERIETAVQDRSPGVTIELGRITAAIDRSATPRLWLEEVRLGGPDVGEVARLSEIGVAFDADAFLSRRIAPSALRIGAIDLLLRRDADGRFELQFGGGGSFQLDTPGDLFDAAEALLDRAPFDRAERVELEEVSIRLEDARSARVWQVTGGTAVLERGADGLEATLNAALFNGTDDLARLQASLSTDGDDGAAALRIELEEIAASDIALQAPALAFLGVLDAPISGALRAVLGSDGELASLAGTLSIAEGDLQPRPGIPPVHFNKATAYLDFDPATNRIEFSEVSVDGEQGSARLSGHADLSQIGANGFPAALLGQFQIEALRLDTPALFPDPVELSGGTADLRLRLNPFTLEVGQYTLPAANGAREETLNGNAHIEAGPDGWSVSLRLEAALMRAERLRRLWPAPVARKARQFFLERVQDGAATNATVLLSLTPDTPKPESTITFGFRDATTVAVPFLPPVEDASGYGELHDGRFTIMVNDGLIRTPAAGPITLAGSSFVIPDARQKPSPATIDLVADGPLKSVLWLIDREPLSLLSRAGRDPDLGTGRVSAEVDLGLILKKGLTPEEITLDATGTLRNFSSDSIVPNRALTASAMQISVTKDTIRAEGQAALDGVGFDGRWKQALAGPDQGKGEVSGTIPLAPSTLQTFGIALPDGLVTGSGRAQIDLALNPGTSPRLELRSDLRGVGLDIPAINWAKRRDESGRLAVDVTLGDTPDVTRLELEAPALFARGDVALANGAFQSLTLTRATVGDWFDGTVAITARGPGQPPAISVNGGSVDLRRAKLGGEGDGSGSGAARGPIELRLDRVTVTDTIALTDAQARIEPGRALAGRFQGRANGGVTVQGRLAGGTNGTSIRLTTADAGALLRDAGLIERVSGGQMELTLYPTGQSGTYDGAVRVVNPLLRDAPAIAELLSAASIVGLLEQLETNGIPFEEVTADFRLSPSGITLYRSSAVGASLGLSMDGIYDTANKQLDMQGVVSPIYFLNRIGSIFTRRGEGLFGANFTLRGPVTQPQVGVNPLSLLTPGVFREIFRRPPPQRPGG
ncbi:hypothetical protein PARPLA_01896 [Rhodobacteraceae bacterium THAF1]|uniref:YhdP family protein n=1 Tax=Palleronia sp. THAF1 TaxID=2587842 RepID=UPI000F3C3184|nr:DUF3971 domain-containing protein [Palleronia sp. THAF1]QFU08969.1 hypothetical protein FIU81_09820 [Palleronia sp. THAF1]VDC24292.1 hypothetical protein PARPLA_01896 [Rhodobacteraceae bacterium THAF1]